MGLISKIKENIKKRDEEIVLKIQAERERLMSLSEKELLVEMILRLDLIGKKCDDIESEMFLHRN